MPIDQFETTAVQPADVITAQHLRAIKNCDTIVMQLWKGQGSIRLIRRAERSSTGFEETVNIYTDAHVTNYGKDLRVAEDMSNVVASWSELYWRSHDHYAGEFTTMLSKIRTGDTLMLAWVRGNNSPVLNDAGWAKDELRVIITNEKSKKRETYLMDIYVGPDNSARMIRRA